MTLLQQIFAVAWWFWSFAPSRFGQCGVLLRHFARLSGSDTSSRAPNICWEGWCLPCEIQSETLGPVYKRPEHSILLHAHLSILPQIQTLWRRFGLILPNKNLQSQTTYSKENCHIATIVVSTCHGLCSESKLSKLPLKLTWVLCTGFGWGQGFQISTSPGSWNKNRHPIWLKILTSSQLSIKFIFARQSC